MRYNCTLSEELIKKAHEELHEPVEDEGRWEHIDRLKTKFEEEDNGFDLLRSDDNFILRFLRAKKFNHDKAYAMLLNYHIQRRDFRELFDMVDNPQLIKEVVELGVVVGIDQRAKDGSFVCVGRPGIGQTNAKMIQFLAMIVIYTEYMLENEEASQICGVTVIADYTYFTMGMVTQFTPSFGKKMGQVLQNAMPSRIKSMNVCNEFKIFSLIHAIMKPFTSDKMQRRLRLHGTNCASLHEVVPSKGLPSSFEGQGPDLDVEGWAKKMFLTHGSGESTTL